MLMLFTYQVFGRRESRLDLQAPLVVAAAHHLPLPYPAPAAVLVPPAEEEGPELHDPLLQLLDFSRHRHGYFFAALTTADGTSTLSAVGPQAYSFAAYLASSVRWSMWVSTSLYLLLPKSSSARALKLG